jgi:hypothetical protein
VAAIDPREPCHQAVPVRRGLPLTDLATGPTTKQQRARPLLGARPAPDPVVTRLDGYPAVRPLISNRDSQRSGSTDGEPGCALRARPRMCRRPLKRHGVRSQPQAAVATTHRWNGRSQGLGSGLALI